MRVAWFSPLPPSASGIAAYSAELLPLLLARGMEIDTFSETTAHHFVWMHRRRPYDLPVFHLGNAACHDYMWGYLFRYPGAVVLHDAQLHQARALHLTKRWLPRRTDYLAEFRANQPAAPPDVGELVALGGMGGTLFQHWPLVRLVIESARMTIVHNARLANDLREAHPAARIEAIEMGTADPLAVSHTGATGATGVTDATGAAGAADAAAAVRRRHGIPADAFVLGAFGGITPEKRIPQLLRAMSGIVAHQPHLHLMVVGRALGHYEVMADALAWRVADRVHVTGFVDDMALPEYMAAADVCACLRWPTNRETSASWLRCLAAGRATLVTDLAHLGDVPMLDPRRWQTTSAGKDAAAPVAVSIDLLDEEHSLQLAIERLGHDSALRDRLGLAARQWWEAHHQLDPMAASYQRLLSIAARLAAPRVDLPDHLTNDGSRQLHRLADDVGMHAGLADLLRD